ncbi:hypothetical protein ABT061_41220 [Streptosporangium sp. NPDC002544]|uniref:hypothetical protein n=1 Tax=Streptosporangium sp. NPDC002544 TaxID=3154538 RepID=UPI00331992AE
MLRRRGRPEPYEDTGGRGAGALPGGALLGIPIAAAVLLILREVVLPRQERTRGHPRAAVTGARYIAPGCAAPRKFITSSPRNLIDHNNMR